MSWLGDQYRNNFSYGSNSGKLYTKYGWRGIIAKGGHFNGTTYTKFRTVKNKDVTDGSSHTIAVMEKAVFVGSYQPSADSNSALWSELTGWLHCAHQPTMDRSVPGDGGTLGPNENGSQPTEGTPGRGNAPTPLTDNNDPDGSRMTGYDQGFDAAHPGGMQAAFGDGSVRTISVDVDSSLGVLFRLGCRDDGLTIDAASY